MPFATEPRAASRGTSRACRAIVATRLRQPELEFAVFRALQFGWFTTPLVLDEDADIGPRSERVPGLDAAAVVGAIDDPEVREAYEADRAEARTAAGGADRVPGQGGEHRRRGALHGAVGRVRGAGRAPARGRRLPAGRGLRRADREPRPALPRRAARRGPAGGARGAAVGLTTEEVAAVMTRGNDAPDRAAAEDALIELAASGAVERVPLGDDALWSARTGRAA